MVKDAKNNRLGLVAGTTGGAPLVHNTATGQVDVKTPSPTPVEQPPMGLAKASPIFKKVEPKSKAEKTDQAKALDENVEKTEKTE